MNKSRKKIKKNSNQNNKYQINEIKKNLKQIKINKKKRTTIERINKWEDKL